MKILKMYPIAVIIAVIVCIVSLLVGVHLSVSRQIDKIENGFTAGVYYDGYLHPAISAQLEDRMNAAMGIVSVTSNFSELSDETEALRNARENLIDTADGAIYDKYVANNSLQTAYEKLISAMDGIALNDNQKSAMSDYTKTMDGTASIIANSGYNSTVSEFERNVLGVFPVSILKYIAFVGTPEYFGAEG